MAKLIALFEVQVPVDGKLVAIQPGAGFTLDNEEAVSHLRNAEAVRDPTDEELKTLFKDAESAPVSDNGPVGERDLSKLTKAELVGYAAEHGYTVDEAGTKADILASIESQAL